MLDQHIIWLEMDKATGKHMHDMNQCCSLRSLEKRARLQALVEEYYHMLHV